MAIRRHVAVPGATDGTIATTAAARGPDLDEIHRATLIRVIETRPGAINDAPTHKRRTDAETSRSQFESRLDERVTVDSRIVDGADGAETIVESAHDVGATAIAVRARGSPWLLCVRSGNTTSRLVTDPAILVLSLAHEGLGRPDSPTGRPGADEGRP